jgi:uncharacterized protein (DUF1919 family)
MVRRPCPSDPNFPAFEDYELKLERSSEARGDRWQCYAWPKTDMARKVDLQTTYGKSAEEARRKMEATYLYSAGRISNQEWLTKMLAVAG